MNIQIGDIVYTLVKHAERIYHRAVASAAFASADAQIADTKPSRAAMDA